MTSRYRSLASTLLVALAAAGCSSDMLDPSPAAGGALTSTSIGRGKGISNAIKYSNTGTGPTTGRSGSAALEVRALRAMDGSTLLEVSTGSLEAGTHPGSIVKTQVKVLASRSGALNYNNLSGNGYWSQSYPSLGAGDQIQVQANVRGIDPKRTDVVTVTTPVLRRPDIAVMELTGPANAAPQTLVTFSAVLSELNGDVGARSDCVLTIDGTEVDSAEGIWIDAGGSVSCVFTRAFASAGTYAVAVTAADVSPADWDSSNNSASTSISIDEPGQTLAHGVIVAGEVHLTSDQLYQNVDGWYPFTNAYHQDADYSVVQIVGTESGIADTSPLAQVTAAVRKNGTLVYSASLVPNMTSQYDDGYYFSTCSQYNSQWDDGMGNYFHSGDWVNYCSYGVHGDSASYQTNGTYQAASGEITYYGHNYYCDYYGCNTYTNNQNTKYGTTAGYGFAPGDVVEVNLLLQTEGAAAFRVQNDVVVEDLSSQINQNSNFCYEDSWRGGTTCESYVQAGTYWIGQKGW